MIEPVISQEALERRDYWISEIGNISGNFGQDVRRVEAELQQEVDATGKVAVLDHLRLCGVIPELYEHDSSAEKLYSKYTDVVLAVAFRSIGLEARVVTERADAADVEVDSPEFTFVADAKAMRLTRTAKNQKDFKVGAMDSWRRDHEFSMVVSPLYQMPTRESQIYQQAAQRNVCLFSYSHLAVVVEYALQAGDAAAAQLLHRAFRSVAAMQPSKAAAPYWVAVNAAMEDEGDTASQLIAREAQATAEALAAGKAEALAVLDARRAEIGALTLKEAIVRLLSAAKLDGKARTINSVADSGLLDIRKRS